MSDIKDKILESLLTPMKSAFDGAGLTNEFLAKRIKQEMNYGEPVVEMIEKQGKKKRVVKHLKTPAAMQIRQRARESVHKLLSHFPPERKEIAGPGGNPLLGPVDTRPIRVVYVDPEEERQKREKGEK